MYGRVSVRTSVRGRVRARRRLRRSGKGAPPATERLDGLSGRTFRADSKGTQETQRRVEGETRSCQSLKKTSILDRKSPNSTRFPTLTDDDDDEGDDDDDDQRGGRRKLVASANLCEAPRIIILQYIRIYTYLTEAKHSMLTFS